MSERKESKTYYDLTDDLVRMANRYVYHDNVIDVLKDLSGYIAHARRNLRGIIGKIEREGRPHRFISDSTNWHDLVNVLERDQTNGIVYIYKNEQYEPLELFEKLRRSDNA